MPHRTALFLLATFLNSSGFSQDQGANDRFESTIEPILRQHCLECHSHASGTIEADLALDSASGWKTGGVSGPAIQPGQPEKSLLLRAVRQTGQLKMPPDDKLSEKQILELEAWIRAGASDPRVPAKTGRPKADASWWSLQPVEQPSLPAGAGQEAHPIDQILASKLKAEKINRSPVAKKRVLIRRLFYDLHGLPPTPEQVEEFVNKDDPAAYEQLVDRLLNSPRYGERWARHWLDTVHFADTNGCEHDTLRPQAWPYRDYVIASFNRDTPWPRFVREQLAADHFFPQASDLIPALGFISAGPLELSRASTAPVTFDYLDRDDIVTQTMAVFASTTANCARCHDHKFDPLSQEDYYSLQAVFAGGGKGETEYDTQPETRSRRADLLRQQAKINDRDEPFLLSKSSQNQVAKFEQQSKNQVSWIPFDMLSVESNQGATLEKLTDGTILAGGKNPPTDTYTLVGSGQGTGSGQGRDRKLKSVSAIRLDVLTHPSLPQKGPGRCANGNLHLSGIEIRLEKNGSSEILPIQSATADWNQQGWTIQHAIDEDPQSAWGIWPRVAQPHHAVFRLQKPVQVDSKSRLIVRLQQLHGGSHLIGRFQVYLTDSESPSTMVFPEPVRRALLVPAKQRSREQQLDLAQFVLKRETEKQLRLLPPPGKVFAWSRHYSHAKKLDQPMVPKTVHVLKRGNIDRPGAVAVPGALSMVRELSPRFPSTLQLDESHRRAALANWIIDRRNPLSWRSIVNRIWMYHFGEGLCRTPNDFGRAGAKPDHPELLDWLTTWFRDEAGGSIKRLHRLILLSETWKQSSALPAKSVALNRDADNRWLWRQRMQKMDAESFRDSLLQISSAIDLRMGGPGIEQFSKTKGRQSTPQLDYDAFHWHAPSANRRSIYRVVWRGISDPFMEAMDFPDLGLLIPQRENSASPIQALSTYNNDFVLHFSEVLAERLDRESSKPSEQVDRACQLIWLRPPQPEEREWMLDYCNRHSLAALCRVLFNSNEFLFIR